MSIFIDDNGNRYERDPNGGYHLEKLTSGSTDGSWTDNYGTKWYRDPNGGYHLDPLGGTDPSKDFINDGTETVNAKSINSDGGLITSDGNGTLSVKDILVNGTSLSGNYLDKNFQNNQNLILNGYQFGLFSDSTSKLGYIQGSSSSTDTNFLKFRNNTSNDYDVSIVTSGGTDGTNGQGSINITAKSVVISPISDTDNSNQVATTAFVQDNLKNYTKESEMVNYLTKSDAQGLYVPLSTTSYTFTCTPNTTMSLDGNDINLTSSNISLLSKVIKFTDIPTTDPNITGAIWSDNGFIVMSGSKADDYLKKTAHIIAFATTPPTSSEIISVFVSDTNYTIPANFEGSAVSVGNSPETEYTFTVEQNYSSVGTIVISTSGNITFKSNLITISEGDTISIVGQETPDNNIKNVSINLLLNQTIG